MDKSREESGSSSHRTEGKGRSCKDSTELSKTRQLPVYYGLILETVSFSLLSDPRRSFPSTPCSPSRTTTTTTKAARMMLTELPAMDAVSVAVSVPTVPTFNLGFAHFLVRPSTWLILLVSLVLISTIRAAFLLLRPHTWTQGRKGVSFVNIVKIESSITPVGTSSTTSTTSQGRKETSISSTTTGERTKTSSWLWGLVQWDTLPAVPLRSDRPSWQTPPSPARQMQETQPQPRRPSSPPFDPPLNRTLFVLICLFFLGFSVGCGPLRLPHIVHHSACHRTCQTANITFTEPALYNTKVPLSMAKIIMSRHTFRRPPSRPPPVRATNVPQYQRKMPSMV